MPYDEALADRLRDALAATPHIEKAMFGGVGFMVSGYMTVGVLEDRLVARVDPEEAPSLLSPPSVRPMDFTGRPMKGWLYVEADAIDDDGALQSWIDRCVAYARTLPPR